jgi:membrane protease YdiL (CAAX protease family)
MKNKQLSGQKWTENIFLGLLFIGMGALIIITFSALRPTLEPVQDYLGRIGLIVLLFVATWLVRKSPRFEKYGQVLVGLLILAAVVSLDWVFSVYVMDKLGLTGRTPMSFALIKLNECVVVVVSVILLTRLAGGSLGSIYIQKGNLKQGLTIGLISFLVCVAGSVPMALLMFKSGDLGLVRILPWIPWLLLACLANGAQEELLFRGLFLGKLQPFFGKFMSSFLIAFVFTFLHKSVGYTLNDFAFLLVLVPLALAWGYITQKTDSLWGSILFHAGTDIPVFLSIFSRFG